MSKSVGIPPSGFDERCVEEQVDDGQIRGGNASAATPDQMPARDWHREVLDEWVKDYEANSDGP
jgi:hypothetical protein